MSDRRPDHSFPSSHRLIQASDFDAVFNDNQYRISRPEVLILAKPNAEGFNRLGMVISKKNFPLAVTRNGLKRRIREAFRRVPASVDCPALDVVILARPRARLDTIASIVTRALGEIRTEQS